MANVYQPATAPTLYFIGVTTGQSSIMKVFPKWADALGLKDAVIKGIDFAPHSSAEEYREAVTFIKNDPFSLGRSSPLIKSTCSTPARTYLNMWILMPRDWEKSLPFPKKDGKLCAHAKDLISSGLALENFVPAHYWTPIRWGCAVAWSRRKHSCYVRIFCAGAVRR